MNILIKFYVNLAKVSEDIYFIFVDVCITVQKSKFSGTNNSMSYLNQICNALIIIVPKTYTH